MKKIALIFLMAIVLFAACDKDLTGNGALNEDAKRYVNTDYVTPIEDTSGVVGTDVLSDFAVFLEDAKRVELGCCVVEIPVSDTAVIGANSVTHESNNFIMTLNSDGHTHNTADAIRIWGTLEYVGEGDTVEIWHGCPFMVFSIGGGGEIDFTDVAGGFVIEILTSSVLERGRVYHFNFQKSGAWSADDPNAEFWENFFAEEDLFLPVGEYVIVLRGDFGLTERTLESKSGLIAELRIVVVD